MLETELNAQFTDFDGRFEGRLAAVYAVRRADVSAETTGFSAKYECRVKAQYQKDLMGMLEEGMLLAVRNFKAKKYGGKRFTLLEVSRIGPEHFGLRGLSDQSYYPYQFEIIEQSVADWDTDDKATMIIQLSAIPLNYDLILEGSEQKYVKGFTYPVVGERAFILNKSTIHRMYNRKLLDELGLVWNDKIATTYEARKDPRVGTIKMFQEEDGAVPIYVSFERLVRYHFGVFSFTGGGKSNLLSNILRRIIYHSKNTKTVIFDISMEYPFLLQDIFVDKTIESKIITEVPVADADHLRKVIVTPRGFERYDLTQNLENIFSQGKLGHYAEAGRPPPTFENILEQIRLLEKGEGDKQVNLDAIHAIEDKVHDWLRDNRADRFGVVTPEFLDYLQAVATTAVEKFKVWKSGSLAAWAGTRSELKSSLSRATKTVDKSAVHDREITRALGGRYTAALPIRCRTKYHQETRHRPNLRDAQTKETRIPSRTTDPFRLRRGPRIHPRLRQSKRNRPHLHISNRNLAPARKEVRTWGLRGDAENRLPQHKRTATTTHLLRRPPTPTIRSQPREQHVHNRPRNS